MATVRVVQVSGDGRESELTTKTITLPALDLKHVRRHLCDQFEIDEEEGADVNEMFTFLRKKGTIAAVFNEDFGVVVFTEI